MKKGQILFCLFVLLMSGFINASTNKRYNVFFHGNNEIENTIERNKQYNASQKLEGFKILIFSQTGNGSKDNAFRARNEFVSEFTDVIPSYLVYEEPYFKVKVGNFKTRREALGFLYILQEIYPNAFVVPDVFDIDKYFSES
ncbi:MAG: SPOR domain-containing protein, partial [Bacteroidales bacterium]|nr:SPOR domain-containing protein [Bacteroidales bacterium]